MEEKLSIFVFSFNKIGGKNSNFITWLVLSNLIWIDEGNFLKLDFFLNLQDWYLNLWQRF